MRQEHSLARQPEARTLTLYQALLEKRCEIGAKPVGSPGTELEFAL